LPPQVSIITVYYNSPEDILALQQSMQEHLISSDYEWIVADNQSREVLADRLTGSVYLRLPKNYGFAKANNLAVEKSLAPNLFFVNPDCVFIENCLPPLFHALQDAAVAGPEVLNENGTIQLSFGPFLSIQNEWMQRRRMRTESTPQMQKWMQEKGTFAPDYVSGCALMISTEIYRKIGGFDENFFLYEEDVDLCKRVHDIGQRVLYEPSARIVHKRNRSVRTESIRAFQEYRKSQIYYYRKHHGWLQNMLLRLYLKRVMSD
jgi:GT2 family glycosyltransferase